MELTVVQSPHCEHCGKRIILPGRFYLIAIRDDKLKNLRFVKSSKYGFQNGNKIILLRRIVPTQQFTCSQECALQVSQAGDYVLFYNTKSYPSDVYGYKILMCYQHQEDKLIRVGRFWEQSEKH